MTTRAYRRARVLAVLALVAPVGALFVTATAAPALAASGSVTAPAADAVYADSATTSTEATASVTLAKGESATLTVTGPGLGSGRNTTAAYGCSNLVCPSTQTKTLKVAVPLSSSTENGEFTSQLSGSVSGTRHFYTNFKPLADPGNLAAAANGRTEVDLSWSYSGTEPDKAGFEIAETHNGSTRTITAPASACSGSTCGSAITYAQPAESTTEDYSYTVTALRNGGGCPGCDAYTRSGASSSASAQLVGPPPAPSPTPSPSSTGGTTGSTTGGSTSGGSTGGSTGTSTGGTTGSGSTGGSTGSTTGSHAGGTTGSGSAAKPIVIPTLPPVVASRRAFALGFNKFSPSLGIPKLPPLPATNFPVTAAGNDTYQPTLPYANQSKKTTNVLSSPIAAITSSIDSEKLLRYLAIGLVLLAAAAHVRVFLGREVDE